MFKKSTRLPLGRKSSGTVTVIEAQVHRSSARNAKIAFIVTAVVVGILTATVASDWMHPILAILVGVPLGVFTGGLLWLFVRIWPVLRLLWWWTPEILAAITVVAGFTTLARHTILPVRLVAMAVLVGVPAAVPQIRRSVIAWAWCLIVRHRIRVCFAQFIIANRSGSLPLILWARPTQVGERVWVWLRTGLSLADLTSRLDKIAVACWASNVVVERASDSNAAFVRVDVKRRNALTAKVPSPLVGAVDPNTPVASRTHTEAPTALDLPDVPAEQPTVQIPAVNGRKPQKVATPAPREAESTSEDDQSDWI